EIAEGMGIKNAKKLSKQDLVYKILDQQAVAPEMAPSNQKTVNAGTGEPERKMRPRRRENVAPPAGKPEKELSSDELLESLNMAFDSSVTKYDDKPDTKKSDADDGASNASPKENREQKPQVIQRSIRDFDGAISNEGALEIMQDGYGCLRSSDYNYHASPD